MATKVFKTFRNLRLIGDERDVMVPSQHYVAVLDWCAANDIQVELSIGPAFGQNLWRVRDEQQRTAFMLKWLR